MHTYSDLRLEVNGLPVSKNISCTSASKKMTKSFHIKDIQYKQDLKNVHQIAKIYGINKATQVKWYDAH